MFGKLSDREIEKSLEKIRAEYDHYIVHFEKSSQAKRLFEDRLHQALVTRFDMTVFVGLEMQTVQLLIQRAGEKRRAQESGDPEKAQAAGAGEAVAEAGRPAVSYADRMIAKLQKQIEAYPSLEIHDEASPDVQKLYGTLDWFRQKIWPSVWPILQEKAQSWENAALDEEMAALTPYSGRLPKELDVYQALLAGKPNIVQLTQTQNRCLLLAAQHLHKLKGRLVEALEKELSEREVKTLEKTRDFLDKVIADFRLKDLKPRL